MALSFSGPVKTIDDAAGVAYGRIVIEGATSVKKPTSDNEAAAVGVTMEEQLTQDGQVEVAQSGVAAVEIQESVALGEYCVVGDDGYGRPESAFTSGAELNVVGVFMESVTYGSGVEYAKVMVGVGKRVRRIAPQVIVDTEDVDAPLEGVTHLDAATGDTSAVLDDGSYDGQRKMFVCDDSGGGLAVIKVSNHTGGVNQNFLMITGGWMVFVWDAEDGAWKTEIDARVPGSFMYLTDDFSWRQSSNILYINSADNTLRRVLNSGQEGTLPCVIASTYTAVLNSAATETDLQTVSLLASTLGNDGDVLRASFTVAFAGTANTKQLRAYFGSTLIFDTGSLVFNNVIGALDVTVKRSSGTTQFILVKWVDSGGVYSAPIAFISGAEDLGNAQDLKITGEATLANEVIGGDVTAEILPAMA